VNQREQIDSMRAKLAFFRTPEDRLTYFRSFLDYDSCYTSGAKAVVLRELQEEDEIDER